MSATRRFRVQVYNNNLTNLGRVGAYLSADVVLKHNAIGTWSLLLDLADPKAQLVAAPGSRVVIRFDDTGQFITSGPVDSWEENDTVGELRTISVAGYDDKFWLDQRLAFPDPDAVFPADGTAFTQAVYNDSHTGPAETVAKAFVQANAVARLQVPHLVVATDHARGATVTYAARMQQLLEMVASPLNAAGLGFTIEQSNDGQLVFDVYEVADQPVRLSKALGNLTSFKYKTQSPKVTRGVVAGQGGGTARRFIQKSLSSSAVGWGVREAFLDATDVDNDTLLGQRLDAFLAEGAPTAGFTLVPKDTQAMQFGRDYNLGDRVRVQSSSGLIIADTVRQVHLSHTVADGVVIEPGIGFTDTTDPTAALYRKYKEFRADFDNFKRSI
ncbi:MAG TPA: siphovirus ReqiPepy6 Gp37-like family protein [Mycobacterium sp.]